MLQMNKYFTVKLLFRSFSVSFLMLFLLARQGHCNDLSKERVIEIAKQAARDLGFDLKKMTIEADENNTKWKEEFASIENAPGHIGKKVKDKKYWAVYFAPIPPSDPNTVQMGGDLWVFVDANTGEVLTYWKGA
jgi:hypothetical protein